MEGLSAEEKKAVQHIHMLNPRPPRKAPSPFTKGEKRVKTIKCEEKRRSKTKNGEIEGTKKQKEKVKKEKM